MLREQNVFLIHGASENESVGTPATSGPISPSADDRYVGSGLRIGSGT
jgi:hypothetical protein